MNLDQMAAQLVLHEGVRLKPYLDTEDNWTVLVGYNLTSRGWDGIEAAIGRAVVPTHVTVTAPFGDTAFTRPEALRVLRSDLMRYERAVPLNFPEYANLDEVRQRVVLDMAFNLGFRALGFKNTIAAIKARDWSRASRELYRSKWARQVGDGPGGKVDRADRLARMLLTGERPTDIPAIATV